MRDEFDKENDLNNSTDDDILSLLQDYSGEENGSDNASEEAYYDQNDNAEMEDTDEDLLALLDMISAQDEENANKNNSEIPAEVTNADMLQKFAEELSLPEDILSIDDLPSEVSAGLDEELLTENKPNGANDMGGIFSDVLSAVDTLQDKDEPAMNSTNLSKSAGTDKEGKEDKEPSKKGFFQKLFGKNKDDQGESVNQSDVSPVAAKKSEKPEKKKAEKVKKAAKPKKTKPAKQSKSVAGNGVDTEKEPDKKANAKKTAKKKPEKKQAVKKVKKEKPAKVTEGIEDSEEYVKINKLAIIFVMTFFILIGGFVILGTNMYSYSLSVQNADVNFARQRYTEAYKEIYGLDIKKKDSEVYDKIMTVMFVNKELNSYNNYMDIKKYPEALDSLLKGLERYDKYIKHATDLGIKSDMDYVRKQIVKELKKGFDISEEEANTINNIDDQTKYSINVINTVLEKKK